MLTDDMIAILEKQRLGFVATVDGDGAPRVSPKGTFVAVDNRTIAFGDIRSPGSVKRLNGDSRVEVNFVDPIVRRGFRARGEASVLERGTDEFAALRPQFDRWGALADRIRRIVRIRVTAASLVETPAYDDGASEAELREQWTKTLLA